MHKVGPHCDTQALSKRSIDLYFFIESRDSIKSLDISQSNSPSFSLGHHTANETFLILQDSSTTFHRATVLFPNGQGIPRQSFDNRKLCHVRVQPRLCHMPGEMRYSLPRDWHHGIGSSASMWPYCGFCSKSSLHILCYTFC